MFFAFWKYQYPSLDLDCTECTECTGRALGFEKDGCVGIFLQTKLFLISVLSTWEWVCWSAADWPCSALWLHLTHPGFSNGPGEGWVPFSDLSSQQLWALGLGGEKGKVLCCCLFLREHSLFYLSCIVPGSKIGVVDEGIEWGALHFARDKYGYDWSPGWE